MSSERKQGYWLALGLAVVAMLVYAKLAGFYEVFQGYRDSEREVRQLEADLEVTRARAVELEREVEGLNSDELALEVESRKSGYVREGEKIFRVKLPDEDPVR